MVDFSGERVRCVGGGFPGEKWRDVETSVVVFLARSGETRKSLIAERRKNVADFYSMKGRPISPPWPKTTSEKNVFDVNIN